MSIPRGMRNIPCMIRRAGETCLPGRLIKADVGYHEVSYVDDAGVTQKITVPEFMVHASHCPDCPDWGGDRLGSIREVNRTGFAGGSIS
jgi:hypothetical protein